MSVRKIYESDNFIVVDKPFDMFVNSNIDIEKNTVAANIADSDSHRSSSSNRLYFVHRLDYATSGVLCIAKNKKYAARAGKVLEKRLAKKYYLAVVRGHIEFDSVNVQYDVGEDTRTDATNHKMIAITNDEDANVGRYIKNADTKLLVLEKGYYEDEAATVVLLKPNTGRRHQLRVHCSAIGHTMIGDFTYTDGADEKQYRMFLHAMRLILPVEDEHLDIQTENTFLSDEEFKSKWKSEKIFHSYMCKDTFKAICNYLDDLSIDNIRNKHS